MVTFRNNNNRRSNFRRNDRNFKNNGERSKFKSGYPSGENFQRKSPGRNNHNAPKLIEKYNNLAREALANEDKILSENYFQHADHFIRILSEQDKNRAAKPAIEADKNDKTLNTVDDSNNLKSENKKEVEVSNLNQEKEAQA